MRHKLAGIVGKSLGYYDKTLFALLAPFISSHFIPSDDALFRLICMYAMLPIGVVMRPVGAIFFGWFASVFGQKQSLILSLSLMAVVTCSIGFVPSYDVIGIWAPICLLVTRMLQNFCMAGESTGSTIFVLDHTEKKNHPFVSSLIDSMSMIGVLTASLFVTILTQYGSVESDWPYLFWIGSSTAFVGLYLRSLQSIESNNVVEKRKVSAVLKENLPIIGSIALVCGLSHTTYQIAFTFMNGFVPLVTSHSKETLVEVNTFLLLFDCMLLPFFGLIAQKFGKERIMKISTLLLSTVPFFLFIGFENSSLSWVIFVRFVIVFLGVLFAASYHAWAYEISPSLNRFTIMALAGSIGSQCIGAPCAAITLWLYKLTGIVQMPAIYLSVVALSSFLVLNSKKEKSLQVINN